MATGPLPKYIGTFVCIGGEIFFWGLFLGHMAVRHWSHNGKELVIYWTYGDTVETFYEQLLVTQWSPSGHTEMAQNGKN